MSHPLSDLRPLALGEIIDRSATFWRKHLKTLFLLSLGFNLATYIVTKAMQLAMQRNLKVIQEAAAGRGDPSTVLVEYARFLAVLTGAMIVTFWLYWMSTLVVSRYVVPTLLGETVSPVEGLRRGLKRLGTLTGAFMLSLLWAVGANLLMAIPGGLVTGAGAGLVALSSGTGARLAGGVLLGVGVLLLLLGLAGGILWYLLRFSLLAPVVAMEDLSAASAFRRSGQLLSGRVEPGFLGRVTVRAMILVTVVSVILLAVSLLSGLPALLVQLAYRNPLDPASVAANPVPQLILVPTELLQVAGQAVFSPLALVFYALFYLDMRVRREGLDLERRLEAR
ncbi:hypothetical protein [Archangium lipolyticum]|uniref:hypothetical protein n=1 Tax=Archangium lipolyticum TaxID=2970465 RepID=UPI00214A6F33|nr:hypothetical protein [Archangium lipolyticum]